MPSPAVDLELIVLEDLYVPPACESMPHAEEPAHAADWYWSFPCGQTIPVCQRRRDQAERAGYCWCKTGCDELHDMQDWSWEPIAGK